MLSAVSWGRLHGHGIKQAVYSAFCTFLFAADFWLTKAVELDAEEASVLSTDDRRTILSVDQLRGDTIAGAGMMCCDPSLLKIGVWLCRCELKYTVDCTGVRPTFRDERTIGGMFKSLKSS